MKNINKFLVFTGMILFTSFFISGGMKIFSNTFVSSSDYNPKLSDVITFNSPEDDETYTHYMKAEGYDPETYGFDSDLTGYYLATYGFENDDIDDLPEEWGYVKINGYAKVISGKGTEGEDEHKKVFELHDTSSQSGASTKVFNDINSYYGSQDSGTIELWIWQNDLGSTNDRGQITGMKGTDTVFQIKLIGGSTPKWQARDGANTVDIVDAPTPSEDTWYHIRIDFEHTTNRYQGLGEDEYFVYINNICYGPYDFGASKSLGMLYLHTYSYGINYKVSFDAVSYSWDPRYEIGDNYNEGLLLDIEPKTLVNGQYVLDDGETQITASILGSTVLPFPDTGSYTLTVSGDGYDDGIVEFETEILDTPFGGKEIQSIMKGYYPGTFGFEDATNGQTAPGWTDGDNDGQVIEEIDEHRKVYEINDIDPFAGGDVRQEWASAQDHGTVETWIRFTSNSQGCAYLLRRDGTNYAGLSINSGNFQYIDNTGTHTISSAPTPVVDTWYHIRFDFRGSYGSTYEGLTNQYTYKIYINGIDYGPYTYATNDVNRFHVHTNIAADSLTVYWDAVGYSWDPNYEIGDNLYEGVLLEDVYTDYDWKGFTFNNGPITPFDGDKVFPLSMEEIYSIQLIGEDTLGDYFCSKRLCYTNGVSKYAVCVGISDYKNRGAFYDLDHAHDDAIDWKNHLTGNKMNFDWVELYKDNAASEYNVKQALIEMVTLADSNDIIVFISSGHGDHVGSSSYLCMWDRFGDPPEEGEDGMLFDTELTAILDDAIADRIFVFLEHCHSGGFGPKLLNMPNSNNVYCTTTCEILGLGLDNPEYDLGGEQFYNGAWTYHFLEYTWIDYYGGSPWVSMEEIFTYAHDAYPYDGRYKFLLGDLWIYSSPQEFDEKPYTPFYLT